MKREGVREGKGGSEGGKGERRDGQEEDKRE